MAPALCGLSASRFLSLICWQWGAVSKTPNKTHTWNAKKVQIFPNFSPFKGKHLVNMFQGENWAPICHSFGQQILGRVEPNTRGRTFATRRDQNEVGPTESDAGRSCFLPRLGCDVRRYYEAAHGTALTPDEIQFPCGTCVARRQPTPSCFGQPALLNPVVCSVGAGSREVLERPYTVGGWGGSPPWTPPPPPDQSDHHGEKLPLGKSVRAIFGTQSFWAPDPPPPLHPLPILPWKAARSCALSYDLDKRVCRRCSGNGGNMTVPLR